ncbi:MAG: hypothetical protein ACK56F_22695, partial [bacterium]
MVEGQPAQLAVEVKLGRQRRLGFAGHGSCANAWLKEETVAMPTCRPGDRARVSPAWPEGWRGGSARPPAA